MRIKVECGPPLPHIKAWFIVPSVSTVYDLKESLCSDILAIREHGILADELALVLDGFDLLDASPIDVVRDGDLVIVKQRLVSQRKRKGDDLVAPTFAKRSKSSPASKAFQQNFAASKGLGKPAARKSQPLTKSATESDSSDTTSSSESSDDDSDSDTSDSSSDASEQSSSGSSSPSVESSKRTTTVALGQNTAKSKHSVSSAVSLASNHVPPGEGKAATQNRNLRRRRKKLYDRLASVGAPNDEVNGVNSIPLGTRDPAQDMEPDSSQAIPEPLVAVAKSTRAQPVQPTFMMASLSNKNKRRGFKQAMTSTLAKKIVFATDATSTNAADSSILPFASVSSSEANATAPNSFPRLIPPSEKQKSGKLPPNMIVTSIDVEEGLYPGRRKSKQAARQVVARSETQEVENVVLNYGGDDDDDMIPTQREYIARNVSDVHAADSPVRDDWSHVEKNWEKLTRITLSSQVFPGSLVGWKALAINPATFTPEVLLNVGRVTGCSDTLSLQPLHRPGATEVSFGGAIEGEEDDELPDVETFEWADVFAGDWKVVI